MNTFIDAMENRIKHELCAIVVDIKDDSTKHMNHKERGNGGHYRLMVVSPLFEGLSRLQRHQKVYALFEGDIPDHIHALSIKALTEDVYNRLSEEKVNVSNRM